MKRLFALVLALNTSLVYAQTLPDVNSFTQQQIFSNWVQNRCIGKVADSKRLKDDAKASAAAWLEASNISVDEFDKADKVIDSLLKENIGGTAPVEYGVLKCTLIANSEAIQQLSGDKK